MHKRPSALLGALTLAPLCLSSVGRASHCAALPAPRSPPRAPSRARPEMIAGRAVAICSKRINRSCPASGINRSILIRETVVGVLSGAHDSPMGGHGRGLGRGLRGVAQLWEQQPVAKGALLSACVSFLNLSCWTYYTSPFPPLTSPPPQALTTQCLSTADAHTLQVHWLIPPRPPPCLPAGSTACSCFCVWSVWVPGFLLFAGSHAGLSESGGQG